MGEAIDPLPIVSALKAGDYLRGQRAWGKPLSRYLERFPHFCGMIAIGEDLPVADNRVDLDPDHRDADGIALPRITHTPHPNDLALARFMEARMQEIAKAGGALRTFASDYSKAATATGHIMAPAAWATTRAARCWTAGAAATRCRTCGSWTAASSRPRRATTRR